VRFGIVELALHGEQQIIDREVQQLLAVQHGFSSTQNTESKL
jgi:hypothetical protein